MPTPRALFVRIAARPGQGAALLALLHQAVELGRSEAGTLAHAVHTVQEEPDAAYLYELYADEEAHRRQDRSSRRCGPASPRSPMATSR